MNVCTLFFLQLGLGFLDLVVFDFIVVFGHHRLEAYKRLGISRIKAIVRRVEAEEAFLLMVVENTQRNQNIDVVAEARGYKWLVGKGWTQSDRW